MSEQEGPKIAAFTPRGLEDPKDGNSIRIGSFSPTTFNGEPADYQSVKKSFGTFATTDRAPDQKTESRFNLHPESKRMLGVEHEERSHLEGMIAKEVEDRVAAITDQAYKEGFAKGVDDGHALAKNECEAHVRPIWEKFQTLLAEYEGIKHEMYVSNERVLLQMIFNISKNLMLKELKVDPEYLKRLCTLMIEKVGVKNHVKIKISKIDQDNMDQLKEFLKAEYVDLKNLQIEVSDEVQLGGCKVETDLIRINASLESQFKAIEESLKEL